MWRSIIAIQEPEDGMNSEAEFKTEQEQYNEMHLRGELSLGSIAFADPVSRYAVQPRSVSRSGSSHGAAPKPQHCPQTADLAAYAQRVRSEW